MANKLRKLQITEVSMVRQGAIPGAKQVIHKSANAETEDAMTLAELQKQVEDLQKSLTAVTAERDTLAKALAEKPATPDATPATDADDIFKSLPEPLQKQLRADREQLISLQKQLASEKYARDEMLFINKAKDSFPLVPELDSVAKALFKLSTVDAESAATIETALKSANAMATRATELSTTLGSEGSGDVGKSGDEISKRARELVAKGTFNNIGLATAEVLKTNPELYSQYEAERGRKYSAE